MSRGPLGVFARSSTDRPTLGVVGSRSGGHPGVRAREIALLCCSRSCWIFHFITGTDKKEGRLFVSALRELHHELRAGRVHWNRMAPDPGIYHDRCHENHLHWIRSG